MSTLVICEKRDQAQKIATHMGWEKGKGFFHGKLGAKDIKVVHASGHLLELKGPEEINPNVGWKSPPTSLYPIPQTFELKPSNTKGSKYNPLKNIQYHIKGASEIIIATDADMEGEAIAWNIIEFFKKSVPVYRAWLAAGLDKKSIHKAFNNLLPNQKTKGYFRASEARSRSDFGAIYLVLCYSYYSKYGLLGSNLGSGASKESRVVSLGRVQTSALSLAYKRQLDIKDHVEVKHYTIKALFKGDQELDTKYAPYINHEQQASLPGIIWQEKESEVEDKPSAFKPLFTDREKINEFTQRLKSPSTQFVVDEVEISETKESPQKPFSMSQAQSFIGEKIGLSAGHVQHILEDLYEQGWLSYARTDESELPLEYYEPEERNGVLGNIAALKELTTASKKVMAIHNGSDPDYQSFMPHIFSAKNLNHHGIIPTQQQITQDKFQSLTLKKPNKTPVITTEHMKLTYMLVAKQYIKALYPPARYKVTSITVSANQPDLLKNSRSLFNAKFKVLIDQGWRAPFNESPDDCFENKFSINKGDALSMNDIVIDERLTQPPKRYTLASFPSEMKNIYRHVKDPEMRSKLKETKGIGTSATRKTIIEILIKRGYISIEKGKIFVTAKGEDLLTHVPKWLKSYETTALWENFLESIGKETNDSKAIKMRDDFVQSQIGMMDKLIKYMNDTYFHQATDDKKIASSDSPPTSKMKKAVKVIAERNGIKIPKGTLSSFEKASAFIGDNNSNKNNNSKSSLPSPDQLKYVERLISFAPENFELPNNYKDSTEVCSSLIDKLKQYSPPTQSQISLAQRLHSELEDSSKWDLSEITRFQLKCSAFISHCLKK